MHSCHLAGPTPVVMNKSSASRKECLWGERENLSRAQEVAEQERRVSTHGIPDHHNLIDLRLYEELSKTLNDFTN
jgi:hypothetical protein